MKRFMIFVLVAVMSLGMAKGQVNESKKAYFQMLDSVLEVAETDPDIAMEMCSQIQEKWGLASDLMYCRGVCYIYKQDYGLAAVEFSMGASEWKKDDYYRVGAYYRALAAILQEIGNNDNAVKYLSKGIKKDKKYYTLYYMRGDIYEDLGKYKKAIADFKKACQDEDLYCDAKAEMAICYASMSKLEEAKKVLDESLQKDTYHAESRRMKAMIALTEGNFEKFIDDYMLFMQIQKPTAPAYIFDICQEKEYYEYAKKYAAEILEGQNDSLNTAYWEWVMGAIEINGGNETEMWKHAQRAKEMNPGIEILDTKIWYQYATHYSYVDDKDNLMTALDTLIARDSRENGGNYALLSSKGRLLQKEKRYSEAAEAFEGALKMEIEDTEDRQLLYYRLAQIYCNDLKDADKAIAYYDSILAFDPSLTGVMYQIGKVYQKMKKDTVKANEVFNEIIEKEKEREFSSVTVSQFALAQMGRTDEAEALQKRLDEYAKTAEDKSGMAYNSACLYSIIGKTDIAIEKLMEAMDEGELDCQQMKDDEDFDNIRETDGYKAIEKVICAAEE